MKKFNIVQLEHSSLCAEDLERFVAQNLSHCLVKPLHGSAIRSKVTMNVIGPAVIWKSYFQLGAQVEPVQPPDSYIIHLPLERQIEFCYASETYLASETLGFVEDARRTLSIRHAPTNSEIGIALSIDLVGQKLVDILGHGLIEELRFNPFFKAKGGVGNTIRTIADLVEDGMAGEAALSQSPLASFNLVECVAHLLLELIPHNYSARLLQSSAPPLPKHVKGAVQHIQANLAQPLTITDIAIAVGVSVRSLQQGFKDFKGTTLTKYIRFSRLEASRRDLLDPANLLSVAQVARKWGFVNLSRFSVDYRATFGERPSRTKT